MIRIKGSLIFRLWLPFAVMVLLFSTAAAIYYSDTQRKAIIAKYEQALEKTGMTVALGVELSLNTENFNGLTRTFNFVRDEKYYDYIIIDAVDSSTENDEILSVFPDSLKVTASLKDKQKYLFKEVPFTSKSVNGFVRVGIKSEKIENEIESLNRPVYWALLVTLLVMVAIIFYIVKIVTKPVLLLANTISKSDVTDQEITYIKNTAHGELKLLTERFQLMKANLKQEEDNNKRILNNLDTLVKERTNEMEQAKLRLIKAQETAQFCTFEYSSLTDIIHFSDPATAIFRLPDRILLDEFLKYFEPAKAVSIDSYFKDGPTSMLLDEIFAITPGSMAKVDWVHIICRKIVRNEYDYYVSGTIQNITDQKLAKDEIQRLSLVAELTSNSVLITDANKTIIWANASFLKLTGYSIDEIIGKSPRMFQYEGTDPATIKKINEKLAAHEIVLNVEIQNRGKYGNEYWLELNIVPIITDGVITGYIGVEVDITNRKKMEDELISLNRELETKVLDNTRKYLDLTQAYSEQEKLAAVGEVTAGIAHDLNTPISTILIGAETSHELINEILGQNIFEFNTDEIVTAFKLATTVTLEVFLSGSRLEVEKMNVLKYLTEQAALAYNEAEGLAGQLVRCRIINPVQIQQLLNQPKLPAILSLTEKIQTVIRLSATIKNSALKSASVVKNIREYIVMNDNPDKRPVSLYHSISSSLNIFTYSIGQRIRIETDIADDIFVAGNEIKLFQLWSNLIKNAIEALSNIHDPVLKIYAFAEADFVKICFENNGPAIPEQVLNSIFSRFFSTKASVNGTGLGLTIVQNVIKEHEGQISVKSDRDATVFTVILKKQNTDNDRLA